MARGPKWTVCETCGERRRSGDRCTRCAVEIAKHFYQPDVKRRHKNRLRNYKLSMDRFNRIFVKQGGGCAICHTKRGRPTDLFVDHDHGTGEVRGLLCNNCNAALGHMRDDRIRLSNAIGYLTDPPALGVE